MRSLAASGAVTFEREGWQKAGLTTVSWIEAKFSWAGFEKALAEATKNAKTIRLDLTGYNPFHQNWGYTTRELQYIMDHPELWEKTTIVKDGQEFKWNGQSWVQLKN